MKDKNLDTILRHGLSSKNNRTDALSKLKDIPTSTEKNYVSAALKDNNTSFDDIEDVHSGEHYKKWTSSSVKPTGVKESIQESFKPVDVQEADIAFIMETMNQDFLNDSDLEQNSGGIKIKDTLGKYDNLHFDVDPDEILQSKRKQNTSLDAEDVETAKSNEKVYNAWRLFTSRLSKIDKDDILKSVQQAVEQAKEIKENVVSKEKFIEALNSKLSDKERVMFALMLLKQTKDNIFSNYNNNKWQ